MRGLLPEDALRQIAAGLPNLSDLFDVLLSIPPDFVSLGFDHESEVPIASVCLLDCLYSVADARLAMHEALANREYHSEKDTTEAALTRIRNQRFYLDDVALRLYAAGEHLGNAIQMMRELPRALIAGTKERPGSWFMRVEKYFRNHLPADPITAELATLRNSSSWDFIVRYRNAWVHEQPPPVAGLGLVYRRRRRWINSGKLWAMTFGSDDPELTIEELTSNASIALAEFVSVLRAVAQAYDTLLRTRGFE